MHGQPLRVTLTLEGECGQCGRCCTFMHEGERVYCENLELADPKLLGLPLATLCKVHGQRVSNMPIRMLRADGSYAVQSRCAMGTEDEVWSILKEGIGQGCSLTLRFRENAADES